MTLWICGWRINEHSSGCDPLLQITDGKQEKQEKEKKKAVCFHGLLRRTYRHGRPLCNYRYNYSVGGSVNIVVAQIGCKVNTSRVTVHIFIYLIYE